MGRATLLAILAVAGLTMGPADLAAAPGYRPVAFSDLAGWSNDRHGEALAAFRRGCAVIRPDAGDARAAGMRAACLDAVALGEHPGDEAARRFFESHFEPFRVVGEAGETGLFTGYFEPEINAARARSPAFPVPLLAPPEGLVSLAGEPAERRAGVAEGYSHALLVDGRLVTAPTRREIEAGALARRARPIAWLADRVDAFFLHVQGSGRLRFADGTTMRVSYAAKNGHPYTSIGALLVARGVMTREEVTMDTLRAWLEADPARAAALMDENASYIFFREVADTDPALGPEGQLQVPLTPGRSLAVDRAHHSDNLPVWLETSVPDPAGGPNRLFARLMVAQDTGSAITGAVRGDIFFGSGDAAGRVAGRMRSEGRMTVLLPRCAEC